MFALGLCSPFGVCAFGVGALAWGGGGSVVPAALPRLACLRAHALVWACWRVRGLCARWAEGGQVGAGRSCPAPLRALVALPGCCVREEGEKGWGVGVLSWCANTRAHGERKRGGEREPRGADRGGLAGGCGWWRVGW